MGFDELKIFVINKARKQADEIIDCAVNEKRSIIEQAENEKQKYLITMQKRRDKILNDYKSKRTAACQIQYKREFNKLRKDVLQHLLDSAKLKLQTLSAQKRKKHIQLLMKKASKQIKIHTVFCSKNDIKYVKNGQETDIIGGIIAVNEDQTERIDYSYNSILETVFENSSAEISEELFKEC